MDLKLTNPSSQTVDLGNTLSPADWVEDATIYLSFDQGVRVSGSYVLNVYISARVSVLGFSEQLST